MFALLHPNYHSSGSILDEQELSYVFFGKSMQDSVKCIQYIGILVGGDEGINMFFKVMLDIKSLNW